MVLQSDGAQLTLYPLMGQYRASQAKDANGNFISIGYNGFGEVAWIVDTLGRTINFNYDSYSGSLLSITQSWRRDSASGQVVETHNWATFGYSTTYIGNNFPGLFSYGPVNQYITVLTQVGLPDGSRYNFEYNNTYGQVSAIRHYAPMGSTYYQRSYITYDLPASSSDSPRIAARHDWAADWNGDTYPWTPLHEVVTSFTTDADGAHRLTAPDGTIYKEYYAAAPGSVGVPPAWLNGLLVQAEWWSRGTTPQRQKWTTTNWTQDNTSVSYLMNPRPQETNIYDASGNRRRQTFGYNTFTLPSGASCSLPADITEYAADASTVLRRTHINYITDPAYFNLGFIGLPSGKYLYDAGGLTQSITLYRYDWASHLENMPGGVNPPQHDPNYNTNFLTRGNLVSVQRISTDPNDPPNTNTEFKWGYNVSGSVTFTLDALWHQNFFSYADSFSDSNNSRNTFAYPTTITDGEWNNSTVRYNFDMGVAVREQGRRRASRRALVKVRVFELTRPSIS